MNHYSSGKLLITGEYLVLKGATVLAAPVNFGQSIEISDDNDHELIIWESYEFDHCWFWVKFDPAFFNIIDTSDKKTAERLMTWLKKSDQLSPGFLTTQRGKKVTVKADFRLAWGLGSSSSLISNLAWWAGINHFQLHRAISMGSGYDVVCARANGPLFYRLNSDGFSEVAANFNPSFREKIFFIYLGKKQDSSKSVRQFLNHKAAFDKETMLISDLSKKITTTGSLSEFEDYIREHEVIISSIIRKKRIKEERFSDLNGAVKSLGAWGGDFAMLTWHETSDELKKYLKKKNINTVFTFNEMIKSR